MRRALLVVVAVALALVVWFALRRDVAPQIASPDVAIGTVAPAHVDAPTDVTGADDGASARTAAVAEVETPIAAPSAAPDPDDAIVRGRFLFADGTPARGVDVELRGFAGNDARARKYGVPDAWPNRRTTSDADGRFEVRFDPPRAFQFYCDGTLANHVKSSWFWMELAPAQVVDLGDVTLVAACALRARVVDIDGVVVRGSWTIHADSADIAQRAAGKRAVRVKADVDPATGWALLEGVAPGAVKLKAYADIANWIEGPLVEARAGEVVDVEIRYAGADLSRRIVVTPMTNPFHAYSDDVTPITLTSASGETRSPVLIENSSQAFAFDDLAPGRYTARIDDPRFLPWRLDGIEPGTEVRAKLVGSAAVRLSVVDGSSGEPIERYELETRFDGVSFMPNSVRIRKSNAPAPEGGVYEGLVAVDQTLIVRVEGYAPCEVPAPRLAAHETRVLTARMTRGATVTGFVRARGSDVVYADVPVELRATPPPRELGGVHGTLVDDPAVRNTRTDATGRFTFEFVGDGAWTVSARVSPLLERERAFVVANASSPDASIELPPTGFVRGRLIGPDGASWTGLTVFAYPRKPPGSSPFDFEKIDWTAGTAPIAADGTFRTPILPTSEVDLSLRLPDVRVPTSVSSWSGTEGGRIALETFVLEPGENVREYDVRDRFPGAIDVVARVNGEHVAGLIVQATSIEPTGYSGMCVLDANGRGTLRPLAPATYRIGAKPVDGEWRWFDAAPVELAVNSATTAALEIRVVEDTLTFVDAATNAPLARAEIGIQHEHATWRDFTVRTDDDGRIRRRLALGRYGTWRDVQQSIVDGPGFEWTSGGPTPATLAFPR